MSSIGTAAHRVVFSAEAVVLAPRSARPRKTRPSDRPSSPQLRAVSSNSPISIIVASTSKAFKHFETILRDSGVKGSIVRVSERSTLDHYLNGAAELPIRHLLFAHGLDPSIDLTDPTIIAALRRLGTSKVPSGIALLPNERHPEVIANRISAEFYAKLGVPLIARIYPRAHRTLGTDDPNLVSRKVDTKTAMDAFAPAYDRHMDAHNRIAGALNLATAPLFGHVFVDLGCGSGAQIIDHLEHVIVPQIHLDADREAAAIPYYVLFVDSNPNMLALARIAGERFFTAVGRNLKRTIHLGFVQNDITLINFALLMGELRIIGYDGNSIDCLLASYVKNWVPSDELFVSALTSCNAKHVLVREEDPQYLTLAPSLSDELASVIVQTIRPRDPIKYSRLFMAGGYDPVGNLNSLGIDPFHGMYTLAYERAG